VGECAPPWPSFVLAARAGLLQSQAGVETVSRVLDAMRAACAKFHTWPGRFSLVAHRRAPPPSPLPPVLTGHVSSLLPYWPDTPKPSPPPASLRAPPASRRPEPPCAPPRRASALVAGRPLRPLAARFAAARAGENNVFEIHFSKLISSMPGSSDGWLGDVPAERARARGGCGGRYNMRPEDARARLADLAWSCENEIPDEVLDEVPAPPPRPAPLPPFPPSAPGASVCAQPAPLSAAAGRPLPSSLCEIRHAPEGWTTRGVKLRPLGAGCVHARRGRPPQHLPQHPGTRPRPRPRPPRAAGPPRKPPRRCPTPPWVF
jgi:hypothetical protein